MKKIILLLSLLSFYFVTSAQVAGSFSQTASNPTGAITNTSIDTVNYTLSHSYHIISAQVSVTKLTGTMAGTATLYYSVDGVRYIAVGTPLTLTNVANNTTVWDVTSAARFFRIITGGATTVTATVTAKISASN